MDFEVLEENWQVLQLFLLCQTQWRTTASGVIGLDYNVVISMMKLYKIKNKSMMLEDLQHMEIAAIMVLNARE